MLATPHHLLLLCAQKCVLRGLVPQFSHRSKWGYLKTFQGLWRTTLLWQWSVSSPLSKQLILSQTLGLGQDFSRDAWFCSQPLFVILFLELSLNSQVWETLPEKTEVKNSSVSASSILAATNLPSPFRSTFSLFIPVLIKHWKFFQAIFDVHFFLVPQLQVCLDFSDAIPTRLDNLHSSFVACPCFHLLCAAFYLSSVKSTLSDSGFRLLLRLFTFQDVPFLYLENAVLQNLAAFHSRFTLQNCLLSIPPTSSLNKPKIFSLEV